MKNKETQGNGGGSRQTYIKKYKTAQSLIGEETGI